MLIEVVHVTDMSYDRLISETVMELRLRPADDDIQRTHQFSLRIDPAGYVSTSRDAFGNEVHHYNHRPPHRSITVSSSSVVETGLATSTWTSELARFQFLGFSGPVAPLPQVEAVAAHLRPEDLSDAGAVEHAVAELTRYVHATFRYQAGVTTVDSTIDDLVRFGAGVCQDFAHFWIAACRSMGIAARYVSGYVHRDPATANGAPLVSASHAWGEAWVPGRGWCGYDPTNPLQVTPNHVKVAVGRDYRDVPPTKGVFLGPAFENVAVAVQTRELAALPEALETAAR
jgi:transglutaminase-like putative cysteine protease